MYLDEVVGGPGVHREDEVWVGQVGGHAVGVIPVEEVSPAVGAVKALQQAHLPATEKRGFAVK